MIDRQLRLHTLWNASWPTHEHGDANTAFKERGLPASIRFVQTIEANVMRAAVVTGKNNQCVVVQALVFQGFHQAANVAV